MSLSPNIRQNTKLLAKLEEWFKSDKYEILFTKCDIARESEHYVSVKIGVIVGPANQPVDDKPITVRLKGDFKLELQICTQKNVHDHTIEYRSTSGEYIDEYLRYLGFIPQILDFVLLYLDPSEIQREPMFVDQPDDTRASS